MRCLTWSQVRTNGRFDGVSYERSFETVAGEVVEVELPLAEFRPVFRGRTVPGQPELAAAAVRQLGLLISDKQEGSFALEVLALGRAVAHHRWDPQHQSALRIIDGADVLHPEHELGPDRAAVPFLVQLELLVPQAAHIAYAFDEVARLATSHRPSFRLVPLDDPREEIR